jgi:hypothetical protein
MRRERKRTEGDMNLECSGHLEGVWIGSLSMVSASEWKRVKLLLINIWVLDTSLLKGLFF